MELRILDAEIQADPALARQWECLIESRSDTGFMQSLQWARFKRKQGLRTFHLGLFDEGRLIGGSIFYRAASSRAAGFLVAPEGPVLPWNDPLMCPRGLALILQTIERNARELDVMAVRIEPRVELPQPKVLAEFGRAPLDLIPQQTLYLDLAQGEEALLVSMKPKGRYNIRLAERRGVHVSVAGAGRENVQRFYDVLSQSAQRDHFLLEPQSFFEQLADTLCADNMARFLFAEREGETLAAMLLLTYGRRATYLYGGTSNGSRNLMGGYAIQWAAIKEAIAAGCDTYDFYGFDQFQSPLNAYGKFSKFKNKFGGRTVRFIGAQDYFMLDRLADVFIQVVNEVDRSESYCAP